MKRESVSITPVYSALLPDPSGGPPVGYVRLTQFSNNAANDMRQAVSGLEVSPPAHFPCLLVTAICALPSCASRAPDFDTADMHPMCTPNCMEQTDYLVLPVFAPAAFCRLQAQTATSSTCGPTLEASCQQEWRWPACGWMATSPCSM
jgi:hypothetical protein